MWDYVNLFCDFDDFGAIRYILFDVFHLDVTMPGMYFYYYHRHEHNKYSKTIAIKQRQKLVIFVSSSDGRFLAIPRVVDGRSEGDKRKWQPGADTYKTVHAEALNNKKNSVIPSWKIFCGVNKTSNKGNSLCVHA